MKKFLIMIFFGMFLAPSAGAQAVPEATAAVEEQPAPIIEVKADAGGDRNVIVGRQVNFSAISSVLPVDGETAYHWEFGDGATADGLETGHIYKQPGVYRARLIVKTIRAGEEYGDEDEIIVRVDKDVLVLITDTSLSAEAWASWQELAGSQGILLVNVQEGGADVDYVVEKDLAQKILKAKDDIALARGVVVITENNIGLNALLDAGQIAGRSGDLAGFGFRNKYLAVITGQSFTASTALAQSVFNLYLPQNVLLAGPGARETVLSSVDFDDLQEKLRAAEQSYRIIGLHTQRELRTLRPWNFLSYSVGYMVDRGVPLNTIYLILVLPMIAMAMAFFRQVVGIKALGIYTPSIVAVSFLATGWRYGLLIFAATLAVGTLTRLTSRKIRFSYLPKMANLLTLVSLSILVIFFLGAYFGRTSLIDLSVFPILVMVLLTEKFINAQIERGSKAAWILITETLIISLVCYFLANWSWFKTYLLAYPEIVVITLLVNYLIGRFTG